MLEIGARQQVREALLEPGDHVVAQVDGHDRGHEPDPVLGGVREGGDRDVLAPADAVQIGVLEADSADADLGQLRSAGRAASAGRGHARIRRSGLILTLLGFEVLPVEPPAGCGANASVPASTIEAPPSTVSTAPLTYEAAGEASHAIASAASSTRPGAAGRARRRRPARRPPRDRCRDRAPARPSRASAMSVRIQPGQTQLARTPTAARSPGRCTASA